MRRCDVCQSDDIGVLLDDLLFTSEVLGEPEEWSYQLLRCRRCGLGFVDPSPSWDRLVSFYHGYEIYDAVDHDPIGGRLSLKRWTAKIRYATYPGKSMRRLVQSALGRSVEWITGRTVSLSLGIPLQLPREANILELGYAAGGWLLSMSGLGYRNLYGHDIEANSMNAPHLMSTGIHVIGGDFLQAQLPDSSFDCIRLEHVLEHLLRPGEVLGKCYELLKPGGILVINSPCIDSWALRMSLTGYPLFLPLHLYHHTPKSATLLFESAGFEVINIKPYAVPSHLSIGINAMLADHKLGAIKLPAFLFWPLAPIYKLVCALSGKGEFLTALCRKNQRTS